MKRSLWLPSVIGGALVAALATAPLGHANEFTIREQIDGLKKAAAGLRQLAARAWLPANFDKESTSEYTKQTTWLRNAAGRCDALAKKLQAAGRKTDATSAKNPCRNVAEEFPNLRNALQKENGEFSFKSPEAKARQGEAKGFFNALGQ